MDIKLAQFCIIKSNSIPMDFETHIITLTKTSVYLKNTVPPRHIKDFMEGNEFTLRAGDRKFRSKSLSSDGVHIIFELNDEQKYEDSREATRYLIGPDLDVYLHFINPIDNKTILRKKINDLSSIGLAFETPEKNKLFSKLRKLSNLTIEYNGENIYQGEAETLHTRQVLSETDQTKCLVGVRLLPHIDESILSQIKL